MESHMQGDLHIWFRSRILIVILVFEFIQGFELHPPLALRARGAKH
jgi:hypothetical protein